MDQPLHLPALELFEEGRDGGYLVRRPDGGVWQWDLWQPGMGLVDFTNPEAREWFTGKLDALLDMGVDCFKTDFGERIPTDVAWYDGSDPERMHNHYTYLYNRTVFELLTKRRGAGEAVVFARSATAGSQQFPVHWSGDCESTFPAMAGDLRGGLSLGMSGFGFWSHDIGGFEGTPDAALFKRWLAFGLLSSHSRLHGNSSYRVPWEFDDEAVDVTRKFTRLKARLMPYLFQAARQASDEGIPMMRAMVLEFPDDPACTTLERQYMLGDDLLVAPVLRADGHVDYYVPEGEWTSLLSGATVTGPRWVSEEHGFDSLPLLARPGSVLALGAVEDRPDYEYADGVTLHAHRLPDGADVTTIVPDPSGATAATFRTTRRGDVVTVATDATGDWQLLLVGERAVEVDGGRPSTTSTACWCAPTGGTVRVTLAPREADDVRPGFLWGAATAAYQIEGAVGRGRPQPVDLGHLQPHPRPGPRRRHRRRRHRPLPPVARGRGHHRRAGPGRLPVLGVLAPGATGREGPAQRRGRGVLRPPGRRAPGARCRAGAHPLPLGPAAGARGRRGLAGARHRRAVRRVRRVAGRGARRPRAHLDHAQRALGLGLRRLRRGSARTRPHRARGRAGRRPSPQPRSRPGRPGAPLGGGRRPPSCR